MKQRGKILLIVLFLLLLVVGYFVIFFKTHKDINDVKIEGFVYGKNDIPIEGALVTVINERYTSDTGHNNYDEFLGKDQIVLKTDKQGYYSTTFKQSAFVYILIEKEEYKPKEVKGKYSEKEMKFNTYIEKK